MYRYLQLLRVRLSLYYGTVQYSYQGLLPDTL